MFTNNYAINLMIPSQISKDVTFNEAISKIDSFCNIAIHGFIANVPEDLNIGLYILYLKELIEILYVIFPLEAQDGKYYCL